MTLPTVCRIYGSTTGVPEADEAEHTLALLRRQHFRRVLDFGCGSGGVALLLESGVEVVCEDTDMLKCAFVEFRARRHRLSHMVKCAGTTGSFVGVLASNV